MRLLPVKADFVEMTERPALDVLSGLTVAIVALPLALAFGIGSGLGATAGLTTAILAGAIAAIFGGSRVQVSGPTGAMTVVLIPIFHSQGSNGVLAVGLLAGLLLVLFALFKFGDHIHRIPTALVEGFTAGIAVVIALQQLPFALALPTTNDERILQQASHLITQATSNPNWNSILLTVIVAASILVLQKFIKRIPLALIVVLVATLVINALDLSLARIGAVPGTIGEFSFTFVSQLNLFALLPSAFAVATLAGLESLLSAKIADRQTGWHHDSNREIFGQGLANIVVPFFGGVPATAALARTAVNIRSHAHSRLAAILHSLSLAAVVLLASALVGQIPLAALAGVLIATTVHMIKPSEMKRAANQSKADAAVLWLTFFMTVFTDLITAVISGLLLSLLLRKSRWAKIDRRYPPIDNDETLGD